MLLVTLLAIAAATAASSIAFKIRRDREEELIHRGAEYSRAIRRYTKKMGRYPLSIEDLENTDGLRFLRKRYKDPITGKDFKLLHMTDLQRIGVGGLSAAAAAPPAVQAGTAQAFATNSPNASTGQGQSTAGQLAPAGNQEDPSGSDPGPGFNDPNQAAPNPSSQPISGGVIVGVASASRDTSIREFNRKNHYSDWLFFYDPAYDRGFPINGPTQLTLLPGKLNPQQPPGSPAPTSQPANPEAATQ